MTDVPSGSDTPRTDTPRTGGNNWLHPRFAEGRSRLVLFVGMGGLGLGHMVSMPAVVLAGVALVTGAFLLNTVGKLVHYHALSLPARDRLLLGGTWVLLAASVVALLGTYAAATFAAGSGRYFWSLAVAGFGFGLLHMAAQSRLLPGEADEIGGQH